MLPIIQEASAAPLPSGWTEIDKDDGVYFHNQATGEVTWDHPLDGPTRAKLAAAREAHAAAAAPQQQEFISASVPNLCGNFGCGVGLCRLLAGRCRTLGCQPRGAK